MAKSKKHIEIVRTSLPGLSSMGHKSCTMIKNVLEQHYERVGISTINNYYDLSELIVKQPDLAFLGAKKIHATPSTAHCWLAAELDAAGINYTGSDARAIKLDFNKPKAKQTVMAAGLRSSLFFIASPGQYHDAVALPLPFPLFIKPPNTGGGKGIDGSSVVRNMAEFEYKVLSIAYRFQSPSLVEQYLPGREFSVAILDDTSLNQLLAMPIELIAEQNDQGDRILGQKIKAADTEHVTEVHDEKTKQNIVKLAVKSFNALGARDYGRIDIRLDANGIPHFLEANLIPGLAFHDFISYFTSACWLNQGLNYETMILRIAELGLARSTKNRVVDLERLIPSKFAHPVSSLSAL